MKFAQETSKSNPAQIGLKYWPLVFSKWNKMGSLRSMDRVFTKLGYDIVNGSKGDEWDILWSIDNVHNEINQSDEILWPLQKPIKSYQKINHFPGVITIANKRAMSFQNRHLDYILPVFKIPWMRVNVEKYLRQNPGKKIVRKNVHNRGVQIISTLDLKRLGPREFVQVFLDNPLLIGGHAFDFGVYVVITSVNPLRIYRYSHEVFMRFCPEKYHPFDETNVRKYVVADDHQPAHLMPPFKENYETYGYSIKDCFEEEIKARGFNVTKIWADIDDAIVTIIRNGEKTIIQSIRESKIPNSTLANFFEFLRFDFAFTENMEVKVMEVNMSPNLTPTEPEKEEYALIFEQVVYDTVRLIGGQTRLEFMSRVNDDATVTTFKNLNTDLRSCVDQKCYKYCKYFVCALCWPCLTDDLKYQLKEAHREHYSRGHFRRIFPKKLHFDMHFDWRVVNRLTENNKLMIKWYEAQCKSDEEWC